MPYNVVYIEIIISYLIYWKIHFTLYHAIDLILDSSRIPLKYSMYFAVAKGDVINFKLSH